MAGQIKLFNTLSMQKEPLTPLRPGELGLYVCGPTVYSFIHIGNARTFTVFDVVVRYLRYRGFRVRYVRNLTDVDDKIIQASREAGQPASAWADRFIQAFQEDAKAVGMIPPDATPRVTETMPEIVKLIEELIARGVAYVSQGDVYFQVSRYPAYAKLSRRNLDELRAGERVAPGEQKREPLDFALWKAAKPGEPSWDSPWGKGRPGWHIECSAMSEKYLGTPFDIHGGGQDLIFPHHENEIAQSEAATHRPLARYWMHANFLDLAGAKMSKSLGNVVRLRDALEKVDPEALRLFFLSTHYRSPLSFSEKTLADCELRVEYFYESLQKLERRLGGTPVAEGALWGEPGELLAAFEQSMDDDFNTAGAIAALGLLFTRVNELVDRPPVKDKAQVARTLAALKADALKMGGVLGLLADDPAAWLLRRRERAAKSRGIDAGQVESLIRQRAEARQGKDFGRADALRSQLQQMGVELMDTPGGTTWKVLPP